MTWAIGISIFVIISLTFGVLLFMGAGRANLREDQIMKEALEEHRRELQRFIERAKRHEENHSNLAKKEMENKIISEPWAEDDNNNNLEEGQN